MARLLLVPVLFVLTGCATIMHGPRQEVFVTSEPDGAAVYVNDAVRGTTPVTLTLEREGRHLLRLEKDGYMPQTRLLRRGVSDWAIVGMVFSGPFVLVDYLNGSMYEQQPDNMVVLFAGDGEGHE